MRVLCRARGVGVAVAALLAFSAISGTNAAGPAKPNVVVIMTDDQTVEALAVMEATRALLGDAGATFTRSYSSFPLCCPSRATFLTGRYAHNHGVLENEPPTGGYDLLIRGPGIAPGTVVDELVANVDLAPTIVALTGAKPSKPMDGRTLLPYIGDPSLRTRRPVLLESLLPIGGSTLEFFTEQLPVPARIATSEAAGPLPSIPLGQAVLPYQAIHTGRYVYVEYLTGEHELYDLAVDPWQLRSRHLDPRYVRTQRALAAQLLRLRLCSGNVCRAETGAIPAPAS